MSTFPYRKIGFNCEVGLSDHTLGVGVSVASVSLGATVIEKHFTLDRADGGVDSTFSMEPHEMTQLVQEAKRAWEAVGDIFYGQTESEIKSLQYKRSLYVVKPMKAGEIFTNDNIRAIRPGLGLSISEFQKILGLKAVKDIKLGTALSWDLLK